MQMEKMLQKKKSLSQKTGMTYLDTSLLMPSNRRTVPCILKRTLLIVGMVLMAMGAYAQEAPGGLYMHKEWQPDYTNCPDGSCGHIRLETFVTGETMTVDVHIPTDIVVVVDQSGSMADAFDGTENVPYEQQRLYALKQALTSFVQNVQTDAVQTGCNHKIAILGFANCELNHTGGRWNNTELLSTENIVPYASGNTTTSSITDGQYRDALQEVTAASIAANGRHYEAIERVQAEGATYMQYGLIMAKNVLDKRLPEDKVYVDANGQTHDRAQVVVFFTDGYPGRTATYYNTSYDYFVQTFNNNTFPLTNGTTYDNQTVADAAVTAANDIKNLGVTVFTVGIFEGADPSAAFQTTMQQNTSTWGNVRYRYWTTGAAAANGLLHFISSDYGYNEVTSWSGSTTSSQNTVNKFPDSKYMSASNADELNNVFGQIAQQTGGAAIEMGVETIVQDAISPDFQLNFPAGTQPSNAIIAYAPKCTGKVGNTLQFEEIKDNGTLTLTNGVVTGGGENKLPAGLVSLVDDKTLQLTNFNFDEMWCGEQNDHGQITYHGRKLVLMIPLVVEEDTWGDGIPTNTPMSVIFPDGDILNPIEYNQPIADVMGEVWTEVVVNKPPTFNENANPIPLTTPEDLAWFISWVNGRAGYEDNPDVDPHPNANAILMADVDMSAHGWVPIGMQTYDTHAPNAYAGTFDGNGHVITGLKNNAQKKFMLGEVTWVFPGMFAKVEGTVKNVFVLDSDFRGKQREGHFIHHGIIVDTLLVGGKVFNCEAAGRISCKEGDPTAINLIFGGLVGLNQGTVHSCMAMPELTGYTLGGMIGENREGSFANGFTNGIYHYMGSNEAATAKPVGGIAGMNPTAANIKNCYVRFSRDNNTGLDNVDAAGKFGRIVGEGSFTESSCYSPMYAIMHNDGTMGAEPGYAPISGSGIQYSTTNAPSLMREAHSNDNMVSSASNWPAWTSITYSNGTIVPLLVGGTPLVDKLNEGITSGQASWKRTTAGGYPTSPNGGNINDDYPILKFDDFKCAASADGIRIDYTATLDEGLDRHNEGNMNVGTNMPSDDDWYDCQRPRTYSVTVAPAIYGGAINLYANEDNVTKSTSADAHTMVYIDEDISLLQNTSSNIDAYTCQTLKSFSQSWPGDGTGERWHLVSSSLQNSKFGWTYGINDMVAHNWDPNPCDWHLNVDNDDEAVFPSDARSFAIGDFYCFYEPRYHWINFRRNSLSHWHMNDYSLNIPYDNEDQFIRGKGYLMAISMEYFTDHYLAAEVKHEQFVQNRGTLNNGDITIPVTFTPNIAWTGRQGYNLLGNPYQSYLDFDEFVRVNSEIMGNSAFANTFAVYDPEIDAWRQYKSNSSKCSYAEGTRYLNMHQGFFIQVMESDDVTFNNDMRTNDPGEDFEGFRGEQNNYPLINFVMTDENGNKEIAVLEVGRPENDGAKKLFVGTSNSFLYLRHDSEDYAILFRDLAMGAQPLYFEAKENGTFTLSWNTANANFSSLTLVDNITGMTTDMLANDSYTFEGNVDHYKSRFKVIFGRFTGIDEDMDTASESFAYFDGSEWIVEGQGSLTVTDMMGRIVYSTTLSNEQNRVNLNGLSQGVYLMRIADSNNTMVQKIVVK